MSVKYYTVHLPMQVHNFRQD